MRFLFVVQYMVTITKKKKQQQRERERANANQQNVAIKEIDLYIPNI